MHSIYVQILLKGAKSVMCVPVFCCFVCVWVFHHVICVHVCVTLEGWNQNPTYANSDKLKHHYVSLLSLSHLDCMKMKHLMFHKFISYLFKSPKTNSVYCLHVSMRYIREMCLVWLLSLCALKLIVFPSLKEIYCPPLRHFPRSRKI